LNLGNSLNFNNSIKVTTHLFNLFNSGDEMWEVAPSGLAVLKGLPVLDYYPDFINHYLFNYH